MEVESTWVFWFVFVFSDFLFVCLTNIYFQVLCWALKRGKEEKKQWANKDGDTVLLPPVYWGRCLEHIYNLRLR